MAQSQLYRAAKNALELHKMLKFVPDLEGWCQAKITLASDGLESVKNYLEYDLVSSTLAENSRPTSSVTLSTQLSDIAARVPQTSEESAAFSNALANISDKLSHQGTAFSTSELDPLEREIMNWIRSQPRPIKVSELISSGVQEFGSRLHAERQSQQRQAMDENIMGAVRRAAGRAWHGTPEEHQREAHGQQAQKLYGDWVSYLQGRGASSGEARELAGALSDLAVPCPR
jgi:hypothetical protein